MSSPPRIPLRFFRWYCHPKLRDSIEGDLMELYAERRVKHAKWKADLQFVRDVILLFRKGIIKPTEGYQNLNNYGMYKSYFKIGWRNLVKNKGYSLINIGGLALGMAVAMVIGLWVFDELSFNHYHENYSRIAQVMKGGSFEGQHYVGQTSLPFPLVDQLKNNYGANFKHIVPASWESENVLSIRDKKISKTGMFIGEEAPEMLTLKMIHGTRSALKDPNSLMMSQSTAEALFGDSDPVNQMVKINGEKELMVTGVYEDLPKNSAFFGIQFFRPYDYLINDGTWMKEQGWDNHFMRIFVEIQPHATFESTTANIIDAEVTAIKDLAYMKDELKYNYEILLLPMRDWHLRADFKEGVLQSGPLQLVWFIGAIGAFVLLLACINFMNLSTARSEKRAKEVGIRKAIGSIRRQLIGQFLSESFLVVMFAFIIAIGIVNMALPLFNQLSDKEMSMPWTQPLFWACCFVFLLVTGLLAGSYPALYLSSFKPVSVLKGVFRAGRFASVPRRVLVVVQFTVSVMLIICTGVIYNQLVFVKNRPVGYQRDGLLMIPKKSDAFNTRADALRAELKNSGAVTEIAESGGSVTSVWSNNGGFTYKGESLDRDRNYATLGVSHDFGKTVGWQFIEGRDFSKEIASDSAGFVINEAAAKFMGIENPSGKVIHWKNGPWRMDRDFTILGVIKDMVMGSPFEPVKPTIYFTMGWKGWLMLRVTPGMPMQEALPKIENVFTKVIPDIPFDYKFANAEYAAKFSTEDRIGKLAAVFAVLAIVISCLGLFGLASFVAEQRTKEIGVRKVLGASVANLWRMLSREFVILVTLSCIIAAPLSYYILYNGIKQYEYKTEIGWWIFVAAAVGALIITLLTVSYQAVKAALANPVNSLRSE
ncbi:MAG: ABC transporter permease [Bacteroidetes bacterium]|nr:ABC transporter permease [Bacteroidota bacterium]